MNTSPLTPDDPRLTAYALGEMEAAERASFEPLLAADPVARRAVDDIRATAALLGDALASEDESSAVAPVELPAASAPVEDPYRSKRPKLLRFPSLYYVTAMAAAACFAVVVFTQSERDYAAKSGARLIPLNDATVAAMRVEAAESREAVARHQMRAKREIVAAANGQFELQARAVPVELPAAPTSTPPPVEPIRLESFAVAAAPAPAPAAPVPLHASQVTVGSASMTGSAPVSYAAKRSAVVLPQTEASNTEGYSALAENPFLTVAQNPLSTFAADVDTASYSNVRRFLNQRRLPPKGAVRVEELVNYFPYRYAPPAGETPFAAHLEVASAPWAPEHRLVRIGLKGREVSDAARPRANLVFLLDVSGSMNAANKLPLVQQSLRLLVGKLRPDDRVAIVVYAGATGLALPSTPVRESAKILAALDALQADGSTNGAAGIQLAYDIAKANFVPGGVNRVVLATDGDFNVGVASESELTDLIAAKAKGGVFLSVLGFGMGNLKDSTLEQLADKGNGNYAYIDSLAEAKKVLVEQAGGTLVTIAKDVKLQVEFNPAVAQAYRLIGYENRVLRKEDFNDDKVDAGEIGAGHTVTALYEVVPVGAPAPEASPVDALKYQRVEATPRATPGAAGELLTLKIRYKAPASDVSSKLEFALRDGGKAFTEASADFKFAAAVAAFGLRLKDSPYRGDVTLGQVAEWAREGLVDDAGGYRSEFLGLVTEAASLVEE
jgi:Ca-activated chloride channel family protein